MQEVLRHQEAAPGWLTALLKEIDSLDFGPEFDRFLPDADLMFGAMHAKGVTAIRNLFVTLTGDLTTQHTVHDFWAGTRTNLFLGDVELAKRSDGSHTLVVPTAQFFIMGGRHLSRIERAQILVGPMGFDMR